MTTHELKTWPTYFNAIGDGTKRFELRDTKDRTFNVGDVLHLREYEPHRHRYSGREIFAVVTFVIDGPRFGLGAGTACMSIDVFDARVVTA